MTAKKILILFKTKEGSNSESILSLNVIGMDSKRWII